MKETALEQAVLARLQSVIDPETNTDVVRMRLVEGVRADPDGRVHYTFRPSSFVCPLAVSLAVDIKKAVAQVPGVTSQAITVSGYVQAEVLQHSINQEL
ncbi:MAG: iron-sulfur cluster assembly protein [Lamprocystis purpurea]|jgi:metal-sulfur cluster biosynthetic enzyme|uniref:metal-sulfur cluster assembly factor n=1 Tax=Lamprocystis purpurea TaxID=61598 RepID=UPI000369A70D|nr:iron-sulfur cluster assembly protein [Lamprocystis purpurea]MBV5275583.1 iron-sulfur cluster assembly protein [Lamprocystis purpurea]